MANLLNKEDNITNKEGYIANKEANITGKEDYIASKDTKGVKQDNRLLNEEGNYGDKGG